MRENQDLQKLIDESWEHTRLLEEYDAFCRKNQINLGFMTLQEWSRRFQEWKAAKTK